MVLGKAFYKLQQNREKCNDLKGLTFLKMSFPWSLSFYAGRSGSKKVILSEVYSVSAKGSG